MMNHNHTIPTDATVQTLIDLHGEILALNADIRVMLRWGDATEYTVKMKKREAEQVLGHKLEGTAPRRLSFGMKSAGYTIDLQQYDQETHEWASVFGPKPPKNVGEIIERAVAWLRSEHPAADALLVIDALLLRSRLDVEGLRMYALKLQEKSGMTRAALANALGITPQTLGRALNRGGLRDASTLLAIVKELSGEEWAAETVYRRV